MTFTPFVVIWAVFAIAVLALALTRQLMAFRENDTIHLSDAQSGLITEQMALLNHLRVIDRWGKILTVVAALMGLVLAGIYLYQRIPSAG